MLNNLIRRLRLAYYRRALRDMGLGHRDASFVLLRIAALRDGAQS